MKENTKKENLSNHVIEHLRPSDLSPYKNNAKRHDQAQISKIAGSIREFGFNNPVLIDADNGIIAGHGRTLAAHQLGLATVPCLRLTHLTDSQRRAYILADNRLAEIGGGWDEEMLKLELADLAALDVDVAEIGFGAEDLAELELLEEKPTTDADAEPQIDKAEELRAKWGVEPGQLWELGDHRLLCGDSTKPEDVELVSGDGWDVLVFDPPYENEMLYKSAIIPQSPRKKLILFWDFKRFCVAPSCAMNAGWIPQYELIWDNVTSWFTPNRPLARHKACGIFGDDPKWNFDKAIIRDGKSREAKVVFNTRGKCKYIPLDGAVHLRTVESFPTTNESEGHAHSKPLQWISAIFQGVGGNVFLDLFSGSGTTIIACEQLGRKCRAIELNPGYVAVAIQRWVDATGNSPKCIV